MIDPAPRSYAPGVRLHRRLRGPVEANRHGLELESWLLGAARHDDDLLHLFRSLIDRIRAQDLPLHRASLHVGTLHPQLFGFGWAWNAADDIMDELQVPQSLLSTPSYRSNPLAVVIEEGKAYRRHLEGDPDLSDAPLMRDLKKQGITDYLCLPLGGKSYYNAVSLSTTRPGGFGAAELERFENIFSLLALHVERHILLRIAGNVLETYLGDAASKAVLAGTIQRGSGRALRAVIWVSDLRGFTDLSDRLSGPQVTAILNAYFEGLVEAVDAEGGEVLKFIGDGLLAAFPFGEERRPEEAAAAALAAAKGATAALARLNAQPPEALAEIDGWHPLRNGIALHEGEVFFGNVGGPRRLDFTVIGQAVNEASRVEALSKALGQTLLITAPVAAYLNEPLEDLGSHRLRGLAEPLALFTPSSVQDADPPTGTKS